MKYDTSNQGGTSTATAERSTNLRVGAPPSETDKQEMMRRAQQAGSPGPGHKALEHYVGNWKCEVKCWMEPNGQPQQSQGTARVTWIMGGRFLQEEFQGEMLGRPFHGRSVLGFNNLKQTYQSTWIDDMNTAMFVNEGKGDAKQITLEGRGSCPATGRVDVPMRAVLRVVDANKHIFEMFDGGKGNAKTMEITYTRQ